MPYVEARSLHDTLGLVGSDWDITMRTALPLHGLENFPVSPSPELFALRHRLLAAQVELELSHDRTLAEMHHIPPTAIDTIRQQTLELYEADTPDDAYTKAVKIGNIALPIGEGTAPGVPVATLEARGAVPLTSGTRRTQTTNARAIANNMIWYMLSPHADPHTSYQPQAETDLSTRELQVGLLAVLGIANPQIATHLELAENTVKTYLRTLRAQVGVKDRSELLDALVERNHIQKAPPRLRAPKTR
jgi:DNA-binding CsgD family transcriptional regulator